MRVGFRIIATTVLVAAALLVPTIIAAPGFSHELAVAQELATMARRLMCRVVLDCDDVPIDDAIAIAERPEVIFATFADAIRVPGSHKSLLEAKAHGADVRVVYSPLDALNLARQNKDREVVFFGLGFETTAPSTALTILEAAETAIENFSVFCNQVTIIPAIKALLDSPDLRLDGFVGPGHVSMVIGTRPYSFIATHYGKPLVISGFEPLDILRI